MSGEHVGQRRLNGVNIPCFAFVNAEKPRSGFCEYGTLKAMAAAH